MKGIVFNIIENFVGEIMTQYSFKRRDDSINYVRTIGIADFIRTKTDTYIIKNIRMNILGIGLAEIPKEISSKRKNN